MRRSRLAVFALLPLLLAAPACAGCGGDSTPQRDGYTVAGAPNDSGLSAADFPSSLGDRSSCGDFLAASAHDRSNFLRARKNLTKREALIVAQYVAGLCEASVKTSGGDGGRASPAVEGAFRMALDSGRWD